MTEELFRQDAYLASCPATVTGVDELGLELDRTVFYPMGGGQPGDRGVLTLEDGTEIAITDTRKGERSGQILHLTAERPDAGLVGARVSARIDWQRRHRLMRVHTALPFMCCLKEAPVVKLPGGLQNVKMRRTWSVVSHWVIKTMCWHRYCWICRRPHR